MHRLVRRGKLRQKLLNVAVGTLVTAAAALWPFCLLYSAGSQVAQLCTSTS
jgi:hypothetical protein